VYEAAQAKTPVLATNDAVRHDCQDSLQDLPFPAAVLIRLHE
jgi:hypothetical protein